jgi:hypothetical protein
MSMKEAQEGMSIDLYGSIVSEGRKEEMEEMSNRFENNPTRSVQQEVKGVPLVSIG